MKPIDEISSDVIGVAMAIHREIGPGLLESVYQAILAKKLTRLGYAVETEKPLGFSFEDLEFPAAFKVDLLVDQSLVVELKSVERMQPVHSKQLLTYLRLMNLPVGLLINFGCETLKEGIKRVVNNHDR
ncbi:GxxExxY protein [Sphingorhabdus pulchriflava]|uniref:GxxExxY protein n=1 Tax=Sphingorhabdus pulchriflava TaxID=2292257 RepID=A0A371B5M0_9SPHN|nr:GxxExxY protein [Sphingorhabdus pulchriflava]RDV02879.1 GxxExxY protein [Sphingorhabdus pulchriflava]